ncbi:MAG: acyl-CoA dehydrogenase family protein [Acidimicrobiales bacterium]
MSITQHTRAVVDHQALTAVAVDAGRRSGEIESLRRLPADIVDGLIDSCVMRLWVPARYGGVEGSVADLIDVLDAVSYHDGATGWCIMIANTTALNGGFLDPVFAEEIYGDPRAVTGGFGMPAGTGVAVDGGIRVTGQWAWGSGSHHCTWVGGGVRIVDDTGTPTKLADGTAAPFVYFDRSDVELLDTWHVMGLKGTGSTDYQVDDAFVPTGRWVSFAAGPEPVVDSPLYRFSFLGALGVGVASVTLGLARRAIDELVLLGDKKPQGSSRSLSERATVQADLAAAEAAVRSASAFIHEVVAECWDAAEHQGEMSGEQKRLLRLAANNAAERSAHAVGLCYRAGGGSALYETSPLQRVFRDVNVATQHGMIAPRLLEPLGRMRFGLPTDTRQF